MRRRDESAEVRFNRFLSQWLALSLSRPESRGEGTEVSEHEHVKVPLYRLRQFSNQPEVYGWFCVACPVARVGQHLMVPAVQEEESK